MALNTSKCNHLTPLYFKRVKVLYVCITRATCILEASHVMVYVLLQHHIVCVSAWFAAFSECRLIS